MDNLLTKVVNDPSLSDISSTVGRHELELLAAKARRRADVLKLQLTLCDGSVIDMEALPQWTVGRLKRLIERIIASRLEATCGSTFSISWKMHWKRWALVYDGAELDDGRRRLESYGLTRTTGLHFKLRRRTRPNTATTKATTSTHKRRTQTPMAHSNGKPRV